MRTTSIYRLVSNPKASMRRRKKKRVRFGEASDDR